MREGWKKKKLGDVSKVQRGLTYSRKDTVDISENIVLRATNISLENQKLDFSELKYLNNNFKIDDKYKLKKSSILICFSSGSKSHLGKVALVDSDYNFSFGGFIGQINPSNEIDSQYLFYNLISENYRSYILGLTDGVNINNLKSNDLKNFQIPIPPLPEQKQIVTLLDKAFAAIEQAQANIEKNIKNAKELFQSKLNEIFSQPARPSGGKGEGDAQSLSKGWEVKTLGEIGTLTSSKRIFKKEYVKKGVPFYRSKEIKELGNQKEISLELFISEERYNEIKEKFGIPKQGDVLLTAVGTIGEMYVVKKDDKFYFKDGNIMWLKDFDTLNSYYLKFALSNYVEQLNSMSKGSAYSALTISTLKKYRIPVPSEYEQIEIVNSLDELKRNTIDVESHYHQKLANLEDLKKSILQKAFSGALTVSNHD